MSRFGAIKFFLERAVDSFFLFRFFEKMLGSAHSSSSDIISIFDLESILTIHQNL
eukprot:m.186777 g.186777  ORF g.186777 m.186777 type:complete len:55 (+) comp15596_c0_seq8:2234-2398(+)